MFPTLNRNVATNVTFDAIKRKDTLEVLRFFTALDKVQTRKILSRRGIIYRDNELKRVSKAIDNGEIKDFDIDDFLHQFRIKKRQVKRLKNIKLV